MPDSTMKAFDKPLQALAAALFGLGLAASVSAANGAGHYTRTSSEYNEAVNRAYKDYETANRRCEVLGIDERILCRRDSLAARRTAIEEAQVQRDPSPLESAFRQAGPQNSPRAKRLEND